MLQLVGQKLEVRKYVYEKVLWVKIRAERKDGMEKSCDEDRRVM